MATAAVQKNAKIGSTGVDPKEIAAIEKSVAGKEQAPTVSDQAGSFVDWTKIRDQLGQPFDAEAVPIRKLRQIRRDAMIAFGLHYRKTPLVRVQWHVNARDKNGPNAQIAGFLDAAWRAIHARYIFQHTQDFDFGYAGIVKRFKLGNPGGVYYDPTEADPTKALKPVWDEGNVDPYIWQTFVGLPPERIEPDFDQSTGEFTGITYTLSTAERGTARGAGGNATTRPIDVYHSLWATNDKDSVFGSIYGYPLIAHAYRFWWSYWFLWANLDRAFERMAVPPMVAYHPGGTYTDEETGDSRPHWEIAIEAANALRSNSVAAVPGTIATAGLEERGTQQREWSFEFLSVPTQNFDAIGTRLSYLDVMKLRAIWVPEQAFIEGDGGTSSRNVAAQMAEIFMESQANKWEEIADHVNRYIFPQLLAINFPEFVNNGGRATIEGHGFAQEDQEFLKQLIQLIGQSDPQAINMVDFREAFDRLEIPLKTPAQLANEQQQLAAAPTTVPQVTPVPGSVGTIANPAAAPGGTNGGSIPGVSAGGATGGGATAVAGFSDQPFVYINPNPLIELSEHDDFLASLPDTDHYQDKAMRALAVQLRKTWLGFLREAYPDFAKSVNDAVIKLDDEADIELAEKSQRQKAETIANRLLKKWTVGSKRLAQAEASSRTIIERMVKRAAVISGRREALEESSYQDWLDRQVARLVKSVEKTTKENLRSFLVNSIMTGQSGSEIAKGVSEHFDEFPDWRADMIARSETRDAFNAGTLITAKDDGLKYVKAKDAQLGPTDDFCEERNGKLFTIREAWKQMTKTHPRDTLSFTPIVRASFSIESVNELPEGAPEDSVAWFDAESCTAYVPTDMNDDDYQMFIDAVLEVI